MPLNIFIINGHQPYPFAQGRLNAAFIDRARDFLAGRGHAIRETRSAEDFEVEAEVANHQWADTVVMQFPVNWMGAPWSFKKYMDEIYPAGMDGRMCYRDGRTAEAPKANYGTGGTLRNTRYMLSVTLNAPAEAFDDPAEVFFQGGSLDDLLRSMHLNAGFFGMQPLATFGAFDVMKNPDIDGDFACFDSHLASVFAPETDHVAA